MRYADTQGIRTGRAGDIDQTLHLKARRCRIDGSIRRVDYPDLGLVRSTQVDVGRDIPGGSIGIGDRAFYIDPVRTVIFGVIDIDILYDTGSGPGNGLICRTHCPLINAGGAVDNDLSPHFKQAAG